MKRKLMVQSAFGVFSLAGSLALAQTAAPVDTGDASANQSLVKLEAPAAIAKRLAWWSDARFGMFIHWGLYSQDGCFYKGTNGGSEHMMLHLKIPLADYRKIADDFDPTNFNAEQWVSIAKDAGMKYMVITSKHHDGFAMYNSPSYKDYNIATCTPWKRDPIKELAAACRKQGLKFGVYYSLGRDWADPDVPTRNGYRSNTWDYPDEEKKVFAKYFERKVKPQIRELLTQYGPVAVLWFDTPERISKAESEELVHLIHSLQPDCIINQRVGNRLGDYRVAEQSIPANGFSDPWETCMTLNKHWGYFKGDENWKPAETVIRNLVDIVSKGGNYLLNVGPTGQGIIPDGAVADLQAVGKWMKENGESIYGTSANPLKTHPEWGRVTEKKKGNRSMLYLHVFQWPTDGKLVIDGLPSTAKSAHLLVDSKHPIGVSNANGAATIQLPAAANDPIDTVVVLEL